MVEEWNAAQHAPAQCMLGQGAKLSSSVYGPYGWTGNTNEVSEKEKGRNSCSACQKAPCRNRESRRGTLLIPIAALALICSNILPSALNGKAHDSLWRFVALPAPLRLTCHFVPRMRRKWFIYPTHLSAVRKSVCLELSSGGLALALAVSSEIHLLDPDSCIIDAGIIAVVIMDRPIDAPSVRS